MVGHLRFNSARSKSKPIRARISDALFDFLEIGRYRPNVLAKTGVLLMVMVKGLSIIDFRKVVLEKFGVEGVEKVKAAMTEADRNIVYSDDMLPISWVDLDVAMRHLLTFDKVLGQGDYAAARDAIKALADRQIRGIYSILLKADSPKVALKKVDKAWERYYDAGEVTIEFPSDHTAISKITKCPRLPLHHELLVVPYMEHLLTLCGAKRAAGKHTQCVATGGDYCVTEYEWG
jgi:hypothetical protein